ncbi:DMT family transporter [Pelagibius sp. Alg239-R121]|uniref:DMT family transporter n=1 Tax=Pelagibius sp. Alg239-R121 TaxID=2993448 RepID=UPI0024A74649|nr:DMT family transporter [Pelagibius sp. Alg239-R121]
MTKIRQGNFRLFVGVFFAVAGASLFATKSIIVKLSYEAGMTTEELMAARYAFCLPVYLLMSLIAVRNKKLPAIDRKVEFVSTAVVLGVLGYWLSSYFDFIGLRYIDANVERMVLFTYPLLTIFFGWIIFGHRLGRVAVGGSVFAYCGLGLMFAFNDDLGATFTLGVIFVFLAAICFALFQLNAKRAIMVGGATLTTAIMMSAACLAALVAYVVSNGITVPELTSRLLVLILILSIGGTVLPSLLFGFALERISSELNASLGALGPIITLALAATILGESMSLLPIVGAAIVLAGVSLVTISEIRAKRPSG